MSSLQSEWGDHSARMSDALIDDTLDCLCGVELKKSTDVPLGGASKFKADNTAKKK